MSFEAIDQAATNQFVVIGTGVLINRSPKYHKPAFDGAMHANCGTFDRKGGQRLQKRHADMQGIDPCQKCFPGGTADV